MMCHNGRRGNPRGKVGALFLDTYQPWFYLIHATYHCHVWTDNRRWRAGPYLAYSAYWSGRY